MQSVLRLLSFRSVSRTQHSALARVRSALAQCLFACGVLAGVVGGLFVAVPTAMAQDRTYVVEVIVFENMSEAKKGSSGQLYFPRMRSGIGLNSDKAASLGFKLLDDTSNLQEAADKIRASGNYRFLRHFAWQQPGLDAKNAQAIRVSIGSTMKMYLPEDLSPYEKFVPASPQPQPGRTRELTTSTVNGTLKLRLGRFLHLDAHLVFTDTENQKSYRLNQSRKMRSGEFHYIDNPRFGLLVKVVPVNQN